MGPPARPRVCKVCRDIITTAGSCVFCGRPCGRPARPSPGRPRPKAGGSAGPAGHDRHDPAARPGWAGPARALPLRLPPPASACRCHGPAHPVPVILCIIQVYDRRRIATAPPGLEAAGPPAFRPSGPPAEDCPGCPARGRQCAAASRRQNKSNNSVTAQRLDSGLRHPEILDYFFFYGTARKDKRL